SMEPPSSLGGMERVLPGAEATLASFNGAAEFTRRNARRCALARVRREASMEPPSSLGGMRPDGCASGCRDGLLQWSRRVHSAECDADSDSIRREFRASMEPPSSLGGMGELVVTERIVHSGLQWSRRVHSAECPLAFLCPASV